ncbi:hypothetical protein NE865_14782 [Phthorimaea operculella]|nr:hypothetical protein NE865_14782 [Phthorimaea operculella]
MRVLNLSTRELWGGRKWPELVREKDGTAVPLSARLGGGTAVPPDLRLPMLEIPKFDGRLETWLPFWNQYKKIDEDANLDPGDKFGYLLQAITPGTDARQLVESYPITPENYPKCIEHLKSRYAREDLQTQLYVRELLSLIMQREKHTNITTLYDKISAQLRSLETLGVTKKNAAFILPMVESALPEEYLKAWQRTGKHDNDMETELSNLLSFLHTEVEHNQRIEMARMNFNKEEPKESLPTASCLFTAKNTQQKQNYAFGATRIITQA